MNPAILPIIQLVVSLFGEFAPILQEVVAAANSNDQPTLDATLARLQAANDALMKPATPAAPAA